MGLAQTLRLVTGVDAALRAVDTDAELDAAYVSAALPTPELATPWQGYPADALSSIVWAELLGKAQIPLTRAEAMSVPAIAKARHVVAPKIAGTPLRTFAFSRDDTTGDETDQLLPEPIWVSRTDDGISPWHRMCWTVDDLIFGGWSLWVARRGRESGTPLLSASRIPPARWYFDKHNRIIVDKKTDSPLPADVAILIPGPHEGILTYGATTVRHARQLLAAAATAGATPSAHLELHNDGEDLTDPEIDALIQRWVAARLGQNGGVGYTSKHLKLIEHGSIDAQLLVDGRNAAAVDCARIVGVSAGMVDATAPKASLNYETQQGRGLEHTEYGVEPYMDAIAARLSLDDVVPRGQRVRFDISADVGPVQPTGPKVED